MERLQEAGAMNVALAVIVVFVAFSLFLSPSRRDLFPSDETRYSEIVREMGSPRSLLVLTLDGHIYSDKPPLHFWLVFLFTRILGQHSVWGYVLPSLLGYVLGMLVVRALALQMFGRGALTAMFAFSTFYFNWGVSQIARMDSLYAALIALGMLFLWRFLETEDSRSLLYGALAVGLAMLTKGPMAFVIVLATLLFEWARRRRLPRGPYFAAFLIALAVPLLWLVPAGVVGGSSYVRELLVEQNVGRAVNAFIHEEPFWYYVAHYPLIFFPWAPLVIVAAIAVWRRAVPQLGAGASFCLSWILGVIVPFSLISGKLEIYMMPAMAPSAVLIGGFLTSRLEGRWATATNVVNRSMTAFGVALFSAAALLPGTVYSDDLARSLAHRPEVRMWLWGSGAVALLMLVAQATVARRRMLSTAVLTGIAGIFPVVFATLVTAPLLNSLLNTAPLVQALERQGVRWSEVVLVDAPYLWSRERGPEIAQVVHESEPHFPAGPLPRILVTAEKEEGDNDRLAAILRGYTKIDRAEVRNKSYGIYRLGSAASISAKARTGNVPIPATFTGTAKNVNP